jgi:hypothetical protein
MTPFLQLRLWWRRGSSGEKLASVLAGMLAVALVAWIVVPTSDDSSKGTALQAGSSGAAAGATPTGGTESGAPAGTVAGGAPAGGSAGAGAGAVAGGGSAPAGGGSAAASSGGGGGAAAGPKCLPNGSRGVTDKEIKVAVPLLDLAGPVGNGAVGVASADDLQKVSTAVINDINSRGGGACRKLVPKFYKFNPIGPDQGRGACLQVIQDGPAIVGDVGGFAFPQGAYACIPQAKIPLVGAGMLVPSELAKFPPYLATAGADMATIMRITAYGLRDHGFFDPAKGFKKLGLVDDECSTETNKLLDDYLAKVGMTGDKISKYTFSCPPNGFGSNADMVAAASQHKRDGVSHVIFLTGSGSMNSYIQAAEGQLFRPKYAVTDYQGVPITAASNLKPDVNAFDGAVGITTGLYGTNTTPGYPIDAGSKRCQDLITKAGMPANVVYLQGGLACSVMWDIEAALNHAKSLNPDGILPGLLAAGTVQQAYTTPDATFRPPNKYFGGDTMNTIIYDKNCSCWHPESRTRRPSYPA